MAEHLLCHFDFLDCMLQFIVNYFTCKILQKWYYK